MRARLDRDPEDLQKTWPGLEIAHAEGRAASDISAIRKDLEDRGCVFIRSAIDSRHITRARAVAMRHLLRTGVVTSEQGECVGGQGVLLTGFEEVTHSPEML